MITSKPAMLVFASTSILSLFTSIVAAQTAGEERPELSTGQQLFEKEWKFTEPKTDVPLASRHSSPVRRQTDARDSAQVLFGDGLGPMHNATSCAACHVGGGASGVDKNVVLLTIDPRSAIIRETKTGAETLRKFFPAVLGSDGALQFEVVVHNYSTRTGYESLRNQLAENVPGGASEEWFLPARRTVEAIAQRPVLAGRFASIDYYLSQRNAPPLFGVGFLQAVSAAKRSAIAEKQARDSKGAITGRLAGVYGWRGQESSLLNFVAQACAVELGLTLDADLGTMGFDIRGRLSQMDDPVDRQYANSGIDMTRSEHNNLSLFVSSIPIPIERDEGNHKRSELLAGEKLFDSIGCSSCHVADMHPVRGLFSDLLLHDMGQGLQAPSPAQGVLPTTVERMAVPTFVLKEAQRPRSVQFGYGIASVPPPVACDIPQPVQPQFPRGEWQEDNRITWDSLQREWRTAPLWGIADTAPYLHDGRASTIEEAIKWHGGESEAVKQRYLELAHVEKIKLLAFLATLRAPSVVSE